MSLLDEPMFPCGPFGDSMVHEDGLVSHQFPAAPGKSARVYAAIHLCVPMSGDAELDEMIRKAQRQRLAGMVLQGMLSHSRGNPPHGYRPVNTAEHWHYAITREAHEIADAMLAK